jgi:hypothetical protein
MFRGSEEQKSLMNALLDLLQMSPSDDPISSSRQHTRLVVTKIKESPMRDCCADIELPVS